ncbi:Putative asparagine synthase, rossmann-like alpha/beta/alpha sandwich, nucleophile aminohydrolase [Septoria linicola]|uniref:Asparagine synthase, rossmann-like alpha/beta/alpha sandwich, nucleophile aminohydrolase n=1 Tax=Septoria linicola TaxID=215465 RepID=A0A9Q9EF13_9PEZI|nr:putative asparagine synthase, rossmann-like alpha/beta/alpha sandwich, nucleophile aminohydrolase [Septoria linicola]USW47147.1 Putative asparagine synthase, rossmann-like alpha/beta/alpha sandwich, nucleophile aminohydrolase [Septoria linicola]
MCGIYCSVSRLGQNTPSTALKEQLQARGPDASRTILIKTTPEDVAPYYLTLFSTVLSLRGSVPTEQPFQRIGPDSSLCWNGEAWSIRIQRPKGNDTSAVYELLHSALVKTLESGETARVSALNSARAVANAMSLVAGPYAFVYYDQPSSRLFFGRDFLGRRSLLWKAHQDGSVTFSSISDRSEDGDWTEVEADGIYCIDLHQEIPHAQERVDHGIMWGSLHVIKVPYNFANTADESCVSVIPQLSLSREVTQRSIPLDDESPSVTSLETLLRSSIESRVLGIPEHPAQSETTMTDSSPRLAILFSGGLDCTVLARLCHDILPLGATIDLLNVAFQNPRAHKNAANGAYELCPDRITGRASYDELRRVCQQRHWRFVAIDVPYIEYQDHRQHVTELMYPHNTEMDLSIASALYFAARGRGMTWSDDHDQRCSYTSDARVLLSGLGADELFAGYTRHATAYIRRGNEGLLDELDLDVARLGKRNLGRDDRVICHWAKEARFPFLDEALVQWALSCPLMEKCDFGTLPVSDTCDQSTCASIESGKKVLRCLAWKLGMREVAKEKKRAIQFGARTAKMETGKTKGTTVLS